MTIIPTSHCHLSFVDSLADVTVIPTLRFQFSFQTHSAWRLHGTLKADSLARIMLIVAGRLARLGAPPIMGGHIGTARTLPFNGRPAD